MSNIVNSSPGKNIAPLTPSDSVNFTPRPRGIIIGAGDIAIVNDDNTITIINNGELVIGVVHPIAPKRINSTNTTATVLYGVY